MGTLDRKNQVEHLYINLSIKFFRDSHQTNEIKIIRSVQSINISSCNECYMPCLKGEESKSVDIEFSIYINAHPFCIFRTHDFQTFVRLFYTRVTKF